MLWPSGLERGAGEGSNHEHAEASRLKLSHSATWHCLPGCGLGQVVGMIIGHNVEDYTNIRCRSRRSTQSPADTYNCRQVLSVLDMTTECQTGQGEDEAMGLHLILSTVRSAINYELEHRLTKSQNNVSKIPGPD